MEEEMEVDPRYVFCGCGLWCGTMDGRGAFARVSLLLWLLAAAYGATRSPCQTHCACMHACMHTCTYARSPITQPNQHSFDLSDLIPPSPLSTPNNTTPHHKPPQLRPLGGAGERPRGPASLHAQAALLPQARAAHPAVRMMAMCGCGWRIWHRMGWMQLLGFVVACLPLIHSLPSSFRVSRRKGITIEQYIINMEAATNEVDGNGGGEGGVAPPEPMEEDEGEADGEGAVVAAPEPMPMVEME